MKKFILGIGAQKSGTSWLHSYIKQDKNFRSGILRDKELHVWDWREIPLLHEHRRKLTDIRGLNSFYLWRMEQNPEVYFNYFARLLAKGGIAADITPSYSGLSAHGLQKIRKGFADRDVPVSCVFLMRDPVSRCVSGFNMNRIKAKEGTRSEGVAAEGDVTDAFRTYFQSENCIMRTRYENTINAALEVFGEDSFRAFIYEDFFNNQNLTELTQFLGLEYRPEQLSKKVFSAKNKLEIADEALSDCAKFYSSTYAAISDRLSKTMSLWGGFDRLAK